MTYWDQNPDVGGLPKDGVIFPKPSKENVLNYADRVLPILLDSLGHGNNILRFTIGGYAVAA